VIDGFWVAVAVIVADPVATELTNPLEPIVAMPLDGEMLQVTAGFPVLPSLYVPTANICTVLFVLPVWMLGEAGPTAMEVRVGFTKNPLQLAAKANAPSAAKAAIRWSFWVLTNMVVGTPRARPGYSNFALIE
jgi:hypothetical protein